MGWILALGIGVAIGFHLGKGCVETMKQQTEIQRTQMEIQNRQATHMKAELQKFLDKECHKEQSQRQVERQDCWDGSCDQIWLYWQECGITVHNRMSCPEIIDSGSGLPQEHVKQRLFCPLCMTATLKTKQRKVGPGPSSNVSDTSSSSGTCSTRTAFSSGSRPSDRGRARARWPGTPTTPSVRPGPWRTNDNGEGHQYHQ